ncbi:MAG: terminase small subunit, partial [Clostridia bacterium]|nr:terminase small subunit [Clostridia bacterium]
FNVSEIKRPKGGGIEIKFFDRIKALEHLEAMCDGGKDDDSALPFYMALEKSASVLRSTDDE